MRLIDLDEFFMRACEYPEYWEEQLNDMPTVDAIPVEWIRKKSDEVIGLPEVPMSIAYVALINQWRKENGKTD